MATLTLNLVGVAAYVPNTDGNALLAVLPNATGLGRSPLGSLDGKHQARHMPILWEDEGPASTIGSPAIFPGARLSFQLQGAGAALDLSAIAQNAQQGWLTIDPALMSAAPDARVSGQILITQGVVTPYQQAPAGYCDMAWSSGSFGQSLDPVVGGLTVTILGVTSVSAVASRWVSTNPVVTNPSSLGPVVIYQRDLSNLGATDPVMLWVGNICAEDALDWPRNSLAGRNQDSDFKWVYGLSQPSQLSSWVIAGLPAPVVKGSSIDQDMDPTQAFAQTWGGGGGAGCECNGLLHAATAFAY